MVSKKKATVLAMVIVVLLIVVLMVIFTNIGRGQEAQSIRPVTVDAPMPDFTLPAYQGGTVTLSDLKGKNVMIVFPRGYAAEDYWCTICNYKYAELVEREEALGVRKKYNAEFLYVFPYDRDTVRVWVESLPEQLERIQTTKNPPDPEALDDAGRRRVERWRELFPKDFAMKEGAVPTPFPILIDADRFLSKGLGLFAEEWSGSKVDQNIPSVYIIDREGILRFKYIGQNTVDRPSYDYLFKVLEILNAGE